jgi:hypothetical protein
MTRELKVLWGLLLTTAFLAQSWISWRENWKVHNSSIKPHLYSLTNLMTRELKELYSRIFGTGPFGIHWLKEGISWRENWKIIADAKAVDPAPSHEPEESHDERIESRRWGLMAEAWRTSISWISWRENWKLYILIARSMAITRGISWRENWKVIESY